MTDSERITLAIKLLTDFASDAESFQEEPEQDEWWDLLNSVLDTLQGEE